MAGIYIHIPFCKQACYYCDFHFSTSLKRKSELLVALKKELEIRKEELDGERIDTIYFGGGTPSLLEISEIIELIQTVYTFYSVSDRPEITLEANPDDLDSITIQKLAETPINRLSIGIQSFDERDLKLMHRAHTAQEALTSLETASHYFSNISVDLIYGIPGMTMKRWKNNVQQVIDLGIPHVSCYALTVEERTALHSLIRKGNIPKPDEGVAHDHFMTLIRLLKANGYIHYELSNFSKPDFFSKNNSSYWLGKKYLGIGPSAHSFDGERRSWNISNNTLYIRAVERGELPLEVELLSAKDRYNEYIMTGLRTMWGIDMQRVATQYGSDRVVYLQERAQKFIDDELLQLEGDVLKMTDKGKFLSDGIASDLFWLDLK